MFSMNLISCVFFLLKFSFFIWISSSCSFCFIIIFFFSAFFSLNNETVSRQCYNKVFFTNIIFFFGFPPSFIKAQMRGFFKYPGNICLVVMIYLFQWGLTRKSHIWLFSLSPFTFNFMNLHYNSIILYQ